MRKVDFGLIGYGAWGSHHARVIAECPAARLAAVADCDEARRGEALGRFPETAVVANYGDLLARTDVEAVSVVLPSHLHYEVGRAVLQSGKHLFLEKPMTLSLAECRDLIEWARAKGLRLGITHQFRFSTLWGKVKQMIDAGDIGDPQYALIELWRNPYRPGADGWRYDVQRVGDWILEEPIHFFDLARWYFSAAGEPVSIYARANTLDPRRTELQDNFSAILNFAGGQYAVISQTLGAFEHHHVVKITGSRGALWASWSGSQDRTFHPTYFLKHFDGRQVVEVPIPAAAGEVYELAGAIADMAEAVRDGRPPQVSGDDGQWSVALCLKARESVGGGGVVKI
jgi:myo-inositol 2-dehydrogenase / D-chiro-inositol 1-dehydrogenase